MNTEYIFTPLFQRQLLALLLQDPATYNKFPTLWSPSHFTSGQHSAIAHAFLRIRITSAEHPNEASLTQALLMGVPHMHPQERTTLTIDEQAVLKELNALLNIRVTNPNYTLTEYRKWAKLTGAVDAIEQSLDHLKCGNFSAVAEVINRAVLAGDGPQLADSSFFTDAPKLEMEIIPGVLRQGYIAILNSTSKAYKSWNLLALSIATAEGKSWLGFPKCSPVKTLYVNLELTEEEFKVRIDMVAKAMGTSRAALRGKLDFLNLKGHDTALDKVLTLIRTCRDQENPWKFCIIDPVYQLLSSDGEENVENNNAAIGAMFRKLETLVREMNMGLFLVHHFKKGNSAETSNVDSGSGAGVFGRAPDAIFSMKPLEIEENEPKAWRIESDLRYFGQIEPFGVRVGQGDQFPLLVRDPLLDEEEVSGKRGRPTKFSIEHILEVLPVNEELTNKQWCDKATTKHKMNEKTFRVYRDEAFKKGLVEANGDTSKSSTTFKLTANGSTAMHTNGIREKLGQSRFGKNGN